jgi:hypothetical protein
MNVMVPGKAKTKRFQRRGRRGAEIAEKIGHNKGMLFSLRTLRLCDLCVERGWL